MNEGLNGFAHAHQHLVLSVQRYFFVALFCFFPMSRKDVEPFFMFISFPWEFPDITLSALEQFIICP